MAPELRGLRSGGIIGAFGGALGLLIAEVAFDILGGFNGRILGWSVLGILVGFGVGTASRSNARRRNGAVGGLVGGALGGFFYQALTTTFPQQFGRAVAIVVLGALIGFFIGLVGELLKRGWLMVVRSGSRNAREGREYPLMKPVDHRARGRMRYRPVRRQVDPGASRDHPPGRPRLLHQSDRRWTGGGQPSAYRWPHSAEERRSGRGGRHDVSVPRASPRSAELGFQP